MNFVTNLSRGLVAATVVGSLIVAPLAMAKDNNKQGSIQGSVKSAISNVEVHINANNKAEVRGATVTAVSGSSITATTLWGSTTLTWTINTNASTQINDKDGKSKKGNDKKYSTLTISDVKVGDRIDFNGDLNTTSTGLVVLAKVIHDRTMVNTSVKVKDIFQGTLQSLASSTLPTTLSLKVGGTTYTVNIPVGTPIIKSNFTATTLSTFQVGDIVRVYGSLNASSTIDALIVRNASR